MLPSNNSKFNKPRGKTKYFPFKQFRFDVSQHPIILSQSKRSFKIKSILSPQEEQMLFALSKSLNVDASQAIRIAVSKVCTLDSKELKRTIPFSIAQSTLRGHTSRSRALSIRLPKEEKEAFKLLAKTQGLSEQETLRLAIIHEQKSIKSGTRTEYQNSRMLSQGECWDAWSKDKPVSSGKADAIYQARDEGLMKRIKRDDDRYAERGEMMEKIIYSQGYLHKEHFGKIDLQYIDSCIEIERKKENDFAWDLYLEELAKDDRSDRDIEIEKEIFYHGRLGIELTQLEAIEIVDERERNKLSEDQKYELEQEVDRYMEELEDQTISEELGIPISQLSSEDRETVRRESQKKHTELNRQFRISLQLSNRWGARTNRVFITTLRSDLKYEERMLRICKERLIDKNDTDEDKLRAIKLHEERISKYKHQINVQYPNLDKRYPEG